MLENIQEEIEDKIIDCINAGVAGRLIIFKPEKSSFKANLAVERRGKYKEKEMYFQINIFVAPARSVNFVKDFLQNDFKSEKNFYLLFVCFDEVKQKINDYIWLIPSLQFRDIAATVKSPDGKKLFRFEAPLDIKNKNKYSKFLVDTKKLGKTILSAFENDGKFNFKEGAPFGSFQEKNIINLDSLKEFLLQARKNTYASNAAAVDNPRLLASTQLEFQKGDYFYRDIYFSGTKKFIGQEIIYQDSKPIWGMNYLGNAIGELETNFLKEALFKLSEKCRIGQVCEYEKREFKYQDHGQGSIDDFLGREEIFLEGKNIYKSNYQGGLIL
ncbi:MAG: DUF5680 domain-containing protein [Candidatus Staskawiczbacteria bacterium]|jgi:hypothetical protein